LNRRQRIRRGRRIGTCLYDTEQYKPRITHLVGKPMFLY
jgi:hypothetical protein